MLEWLGGMGIIVLAVAILPMLGVGGMQLYRAEMNGINKTNKLSPRIAQNRQNHVGDSCVFHHRVVGGFAFCGHVVV